MSNSLNTAKFGRETAPAGDVVGTTDSQTLSNKVLTSAQISAPILSKNVVVISTNTAAAVSRSYVFTATLTLTLPASPAAGDWVEFMNRSGVTTCVIARNGSNIMGLAEDMTLDTASFSGTLTYTDATRGWVLS